MSHTISESLSAVIVTTRDYASDKVLATLLRLGFRAREIQYRPGMLEAIERCRPQLVLLVIRPNDEGERRLIPLVAEVTTAPIVVLAPGLRQVGFVDAMRDGADACLSENDGVEWLSAHVEAIIRRSLRVADVRSPAEALVVGDLSVDFKRCEVAIRGKVVHLTPMEFRVCAALMQKSGTVLSPSQILASVNEDPYTAQQARDAVKVYIRSIRQKFALVRPNLEYITTVRGFGYLIEPVATRGEEHQEWTAAG